MFDGDALNISLCLDNDMGDMWEPLSPHHNLFTITSPKEMDNAHSIPNTVCNTIFNWITEKDEVYTQDQINNFNAIPGEEV